MMIKLLFLITLISTGSFGQDSTAVKHSASKYWNTFSTGILVGESEKTVTGSFATVHGILINRWRLGIGAGIEGYGEWRTIPVFVSGSFDFGIIKDNALYLQMNAGYAFGRYLEKIEGATNAEEEGGLMLNPMVGYRLNAGNFNVSLAAGYKLQRVNYSFDWIWGWPSSTIMDEEFHRFIFQIGVGFN